MYNRKHGFTLVELLVVIAIISVLAALLLPAMETAMKQARRANCLSERKQFGIIFALWGDDHEDRIPTKIDDWLGGNRELDDQVAWGTDRNVLLSRSDVATMELGALATFGYAEDPKLFFCPDMPRGDNSSWMWDTKYKEVWQKIINPPATGHFGGIFWVYAGVSTNMRVRGPWTGTDLWNNGWTRQNVTFSYLAEHWSKSTLVSPLLLTCANWSSSAWPRGVYTDSTGVTYGPNAYYGVPPTGIGVSHELDGMNAVFVDGSGRWIPEHEVTWTVADGNNCGYLLATHYPLLGNFHNWGRVKCTIGRE